MSEALRRSAGPRLVGAALGIAGALVGLIPWLLTGARLPLQNLWVRPTLPDDMPHALLPINQYYVTTIIALLLSGAVAAGSAARVTRQHGVSVAWTVVASIVCQVVAVGQSMIVLRDGLGLNADVGPFEPDPADPRAALYWWGMLIGTVLTTVAAALVTLLISRPSRRPAALGLVLASVPLASWIGVCLSTASGPTGPPTFTGQLVRWLPVLVTAPALAWCGLRSPGAFGVWLAGLAALVCLPPILTAVTSALGTRSLRGNPEQTRAVMAEVLRASLGAGVAPALTAAVVALVLLGLHQRFREPSPTGQDSDGRSRS